MDQSSSALGTRTMGECCQEWVEFALWGLLWAQLDSRAESPLWQQEAALSKVERPAWPFLLQTPSTIFPLSPLQPHFPLLSPVALVTLASEPCLLGPCFLNPVSLPAQFQLPTVDFSTQHTPVHASRSSSKMMMSSQPPGRCSPTSPACFPTSRLAMLAGS